MVRIQKITKYHLFNEGNLSTLIDSKKDQLKNEIYSIKKILNGEESLYINAVVQKYKIDIPRLIEDSITTSEWTDTKVDVSWERDRDIKNRRKPFYINGKLITFNIPFTGNIIIFKFYPDNFTLTGFSIAEIGQNEISITYTIYNYDSDSAENIKLLVEETFYNDIDVIKKDLKIIENELISYNNSIEKFANEVYEKRKKELIADNALEKILKFPKKINEMEKKLSLKQSELINKNELSKEKQKEYDVFLSHASEDKIIIADRLVRKLTDKGLKIWYDGFCIKPGDSIREKIDEGLLKSRHGLLLLSKNFFKKEWCKKELNALFLKNINNVKNKIFPIWFKINENDVKKYSPLIADIKAFVIEEDDFEKVINDITESLMN